MAQLRLIWILAVRSVLAHRVKSLIIGGLLFVGTFVVVLGNALLDSVEEGMESLITHSLAGEFQVKEKGSKDPLQLFGGFGLGSSDIGEIDDWAVVKEKLLAVDGVDTVVPEGITSVTVFGRNEIDQVLSAMRDALRENRPEDAHKAAERARRIVAALASETDTSKAIADAETYARGAGGGEDRVRSGVLDRVRPAPASRRRRHRGPRSADVGARRVGFPRLADRPARLRREAPVPAARGHRPRPVHEDLPAVQAHAGQAHPRGQARVPVQRVDLPGAREEQGRGRARPPPQGPGARRRPHRRRPAPASSA